MSIELQFVNNDGYLSHPSDPDGKSERDARFNISTSCLDGETVRFEIKCRDDGDTSSDENNHRWHECSLPLDIDDVKQLLAGLQLIVQLAEGGVK